MGKGMGRESAVDRGVAVLTVAWLACAAGCSQPKYPNTEAQCPAGVVPPRCPSAYTFESMALNPGNTDEVFVCLTFSGGGTRAAALAYGVLQELRETALAPAGDQAGRCLLDEVDVVSSVSGGSFTAMALKYWGRDLFASPFAERFLYHNVTGDLVTRIIVQNLLILPIIFPDRIHIAADYVNERIFDHALYAGLAKQRPYVVVNATSMAGERFEFTQDDFDLLGSDLNSVPLGHAVMASSAYPLLLSPMRLKYYANDLSAWTIDYILTQKDSPSPRRYRWAKALACERNGAYCLDLDQHRFLYLLDGGIWDNLGLSHVIRSFQGEAIGRRLEPSDGRPAIRKLVVIVVDAATEMPPGIEDRRIAPGLLEMAGRSASIGVSSHSDTTMQLARCLFEDRIREVPDCQGFLIDVALAHVEDPQTRRKLLTLPTRFDLARDEVDALIEAGRGLLREHPHFQELLKGLR